MPIIKLDFKYTKMLLAIILIVIGNYYFQKFIFYLKKIHSPFLQLPHNRWNIAE